MTPMATAEQNNAPGPLMAAVSGVWTVAVFQLRRLLTKPRLAMATIGAVFPAAVMIAADRASRGQLGGDLTVAMLYALIPEAVCVLGLLVAWMGWERKLPTEVQLLIDPQPAWVHVLAVAILVAVLLTVAVVILERRQFPPSDEV